MKRFGPTAMGLKDNSELRNHFGSRAFSGDPYWDKMLGGPIKPNMPSASGAPGGSGGGQPPNPPPDNSSSGIPSFRPDAYQARMTSVFGAPGGGGGHGDGSGGGPGGGTPIHAHSLEIETERSRRRSP